MRIFRNPSLSIRMGERRRRPDRRRRHVLFTDWRWAVAGRRSRSRRGDEAAEYGVDRYEGQLFLLAVGILVMSCLDAAFTLTLIARGAATEFNPLMRALMAYDQQTFINLKVVLTGAAVVFMVALADWRFVRVVRVRHIMLGTLLTYGTLVAFELYHYVITS